MAEILILNHVTFLLSIHFVWNKHLTLNETPYTQADLDNAYYEGAQSGDVSGDGVLNVIDLVEYVNMILDF